ncbi:unnamed protein product [Protopolystoma xenopodis]|nr:unnamed protein product [Protopolystoma xenopodis]
MPKGVREIEFAVRYRWGQLETRLFVDETDRCSESESDDFASSHEAWDNNSGQNYRLTGRSHRQTESIFRLPQALVYGIRV